jgi:hypothetical protein
VLFRSPSVVHWAGDPAQASSETTLCVTVVAGDAIGWGEGEGDFFDRLSGCCESAMSTWSSIIFGDDMTNDAAPVDEGDGGHDAAVGGVLR